MAGGSGAEPPFSTGVTGARGRRPELRSYACPAACGGAGRLLGDARRAAATSVLLGGGNISTQVGCHREP